MFFFLERCIVPSTEHIFDGKVSESLIFSRLSLCDPIPAGNNVHVMGGRISSNWEILEPLSIPFGD